MSTFTSPPSEPAIALLWGDRWWISGNRDPLPSTSLASAGATLLGYFARVGMPRRLRLLYQSPSLVSVAVSCPQGSRSTLRAALQEEYPAIGDLQRAWGFEPILGGRTLLHYETEPFLLGLADSLRNQGIDVEGAWPLSTALNLVPSDWPDTGALVVIAVAANQAVVFRHAASGAREVQAASGEPAALLVASTIQRVFEREEAGLYLVALDDMGSRLVAQVATPQQSGTSELNWPAVCQAATTLSRSQPNQLLPHLSRIGANQVVTSVAVVAMASAVVLGIRLAREISEDRRAAFRSQAGLVQLRTEVDHLRGNAAEARSLRAAITQARGRSDRTSVLLRALAPDAPPQVVLTSLRSNQEGFTLMGGVSAPGLAADHWRRWIDRLRGPDVPWRLAVVDAAPPAAAFTLKGAWR